MTEKELFSTAQAADVLGVSRIAVFKSIKSGKLPATRVGRSYVIEKEDLMEFLGISLKKEKNEIEMSVKKTVQEYGDALRRLGKE